MNYFLKKICSFSVDVLNRSEFSKKNAKRQFSKSTFLRSTPIRCWKREEERTWDTVEMNNKIELEDSKKEGRIREVKRKREMYRRSLPGNVVIDHPTFEDLKIWKFENFKLPQKQRLRNDETTRKCTKFFIQNI